MSDLLSVLCKFPLWAGNAKPRLCAAESRIFCYDTLQARWTGENGAHKNHFSLVLIQEQRMILHIPISSPAPHPLIPGASLTDHETAHGGDFALHFID